MRTFDRLHLSHRHRRLQLSQQFYPYSRLLLLLLHPRPQRIMLSSNPHQRL
jgi:hypothetical protein